MSERSSKPVSRKGSHKNKKPVTAESRVSPGRDARTNSSRIPRASGVAGPRPATTVRSAPAGQASQAEKPITATSLKKPEASDSAADVSTSAGIGGTSRDTTDFATDFTSDGESDTMSQASDPTSVGRSYFAPTSAQQRRANEFNSMYDSGINPDSSSRTVLGSSDRPQPAGGMGHASSSNTPSMSPQLQHHAQLANRSAVQFTDSPPLSLSPITAQARSTGSPRPIRRGMTNSMSDSKIGMSSYSDALSTSDFAGQSFSPRSASMISTSGAAIIKAERDVLERQVSRARAQIADLQAEKKTLSEKVSKMPSVIESLEVQLKTATSSLEKAKQEHSLAMAQRERQMMSEKEWELDDSQRQKREVERERDTLKAEIEALEASLEVTRKEVMAVRSELSGEEKRKRRTYEGEVSALKNELQVVKGLLRDSEEARKRDQQMLQSKATELAQALQSAADLNHQLVASKRNQGGVSDSGKAVDVPWMESELGKYKSLVETMKEDKSTAMADLEEAHIRGTLELQVQHKQDQRKARTESDRLQGVIKQHEDTIHKITNDLNESKLSQGPAVADDAAAAADRSVSPSKSRHGSAMQYSFGRWTAHRADSRKHVEEMRIIIEALEREGFGPTQATADEVIRHIWWKKETASEQFVAADSALKSMPGGDPRQAIEKWTAEKVDLNHQVVAARESTKTKIQEMQILEGTLKKEIQQLVLDKQKSVASADVAKRQASLSEQQVLELRQRIAALQGSLVDAEKAITSERGQANAVHDGMRKLNSDVQEERRTCAMLQAEIKTLQSEIQQKDKALAAGARDREAAVQKLGEAGQSVEQGTQQLAAAKTKMQHLEGELSLYRQQLISAQSARDSLQAQIDEAKVLGQSQQNVLSKERQQVQLLKTEVAVLEEHFSTLRHELEREKGHGEDLNGDLESGRAAVAALERSVQDLESQNNKLRAELSEKVLELGKSGTANRSITHQLSTTRDDLSEAQSKSQHLNMELGQVKAQLDVGRATIRRMEVEKSNLESSLGVAKASVQDTGHHVDQLKQEEHVIKSELAARRHDLELAKAESKRLAEQVEASKEHLRAEHRTLEEKQQHLQQVDQALMDEQEKNRQLESAGHRVSKQLQSTMQTLDSERERSAEWKSEAEKYQSFASQLQAEIAKLQQQCGTLSKDLDTSMQRAKADAEQMGSKIQQLQESKTRLDRDVATALSTIEIGDSEKASLQQMFDQLQGLYDDEKTLRAGEETSYQVQLQQRKKSIAEMNQRIQQMQVEVDALKAENQSVKFQASRDGATHQQELREVLARLEAEAVKTDQMHKSQVQVLSDNEQKAQERCQMLCQELESCEAQCNTVMQDLVAAKTSGRELVEEKTMLERQIEETRLELDGARDEQMHLVQDSGRQQSEHTDQLRSLANQHQETLKELSAAHQVSQFMAQENNKLQQQIDLLQDSLTETRSAAEKMRDRHSNEMDDINKKLQSSTMTEAKTHGDIQQLRKEYEFQISALRAKSSNLEGEISRLGTNNRLLETECGSLKNRLGMASEDLEASLEANTALNKNLQLASDSQNRMEGTLKEEIAKQQQVGYRLSQQLANAETGKSALQQNYDDIKAKLEHSMRTVQDMQKQCGDQRAMFEELQEEKRQVDMCNARVEGELAAVKDSLDDHKKDNSTLRQRFKEGAEELDRKQDEALVAQKRFNSLLSSLHSDFSKDKAALADERDTLQEHVDKMSVEVEGMKRMAQDRELELCRAQDAIADSAKKISSSMTSLESEIQLRSGLQQDVAKLAEEKRINDSRVDSLEQKLKSGNEQREKMQGQMDSAHRTCHSLREQLQQNRESGAENVSRLKQQNTTVEKRLSEEIQQLHDQLTQTRGSLAKSKSSLEAVSGARDKASDEISHMSERLSKLQLQLNEENTGRLVAEQEVQHLQYRLKDDKRLQAKSEKRLKQLQKTLMELETCTDGERKEREKVEDDKENVVMALRTEQTRSLSLKEQVESLQAQLVAASERLEEEGKRAQIKSKQAVQDLSSQRIHFQVENQKLQSTVDEVTLQLDRLKDKVDRKSQEIIEISSTKADVEQRLRRAESTLTDSQQLLSKKCEREEKLSSKSSELEAETVHMKSQIESLKRNEEDIKDYKKRLEGNSRAEMHRVLAEVSRHMEQQHVAHRNLDKMRAENEHVIKEEGERKKSELQERVTSSQVELDQLKIKHKSLKAEYEQLRQLRKDDQRARRRLESRLDRVNDTLSHTQSSLGGSGMDRSYLSVGASPMRDFSHRERSGASAAAAMDDPLLSSTPRKSWK